MDFNYINTIVGPANQAISETRRFLREFQATQGQPQNPYYGGQPQGQQPPYYPPPYGQMPYDPWMMGYGQQPFYPPSSPPATVSGYPDPRLMQAMFIPNWVQPPAGPSPQMMMQQVMAALFQFMLGSGGTLQGAGIQNDQVAILQALFPELAELLDALNGDSDDTDDGSSDPPPDDIPDGPSMALGYVTQLLKKQSYEDDVDNIDADNFVLSEGDFEQIKAALNDEVFSASDLARAYQYLLVKGNGEAVDELLDLIWMSHRDGLMPLRHVFTTRVISNLDSTREQQVIAFIADQGLATEDGNPDTRLTGFLLTALDAGSTTTLRLFAQQTVRELVIKWMAPEVPQTDPDRTQLVYFLHLNGFVFNADGTLAPDEDQPFPVSAGESGQENT